MKIIGIIAIEYGDIQKQHSAYRHLSSIEIQKHNYPQATTYLRPSAQGESLEEAAMVHGIDADVLTAQINDFLANK